MALGSINMFAVGCFPKKKKMKLIVKMRHTLVLREHEAFSHQYELIFFTNGIDTDANEIVEKKRKGKKNNFATVFLFYIFDFLLLRQ